MGPLIMRWLALLAFLLFPSFAHAQATVVTSCGSTTLTAGTSHFVTVDTNGQSCQSGAGSGTGPTSVWSATDAAAGGMTLSNGGLTVSASNAVVGSIRNTTSHSSGKVYIEVLAGTPGPAYQVGAASSGITVTNYLGTSNYSFGINVPYTNIAASAGFSGATTTTIGRTLVPGDVIGLAVDFTTNNIWISFNNVWDTGNPATGTSPTQSFVPATVGPLFFAMGFINGYGPNTWTLQPTAASQKYAPPSGFTAWDGGAAPTGCAEATAYLARATGETAHPADLTTLICGLVTDGVWSKLDALYVLAQQTQADARFNLISTSYSLTSGLRIGPSPRVLTFTPYVGFSNFVSGMDTGFNPTTAPSPHFIQNSANYGIWSYATVVEGAGQISISNINHIFDAYTGNFFYARVNSSAVTSVPNPATKGLYTGDRPDAATVVPYVNGASQGNLSFSSVAPDSGNFVIGNFFGATAQTLCEAHVGASLGSAGNLALYNRLRTYLTSVGVP